MPGHFRDLCNAGLQQHIEAWKRQGGSLGYADQANEQKAVRDAVPELAGYSCSAERQVLRRLDKAFAAFLRVGDGLVFKGGRLRLVGVPGLVKVR